MIEGSSACRTIGASVVTTWPELDCTTRSIGISTTARIRLAKQTTSEKTVRRAWSGSRASWIAADSDWNSRTRLSGGGSRRRARAERNDLMGRPRQEVAVLLVPQGAVDVAAFEQLVVPPDVVDPAALEHEDRVGGDQR